MSITADIDTRLAANRERAGTIFATLTREGRTHTPSAEEKAAIEQLVADNKHLEARKQQVQTDAEMMDAIEAIATRGTGAPPDHRRRTAPLSLGAQFVEHAAIADWLQRRPTQQVQSQRVELFAAILSEDPASGGALVETQVLPGIVPLPIGVPSIAQLFTTQPTSHTSVTFLREKTFTNAAAVVPEAGQKPESAATYEQVTEAVKKIATYLTATKEILEDQAQLRSYIDARLRGALLNTLDDEIVNGTGGSDHFQGLLTHPDLAPAVVGTPATAIDDIAKQISAIETATERTVTGLGLHPSDWLRLRQVKTTTGEYLSGSPFASAGKLMLHDKPVALSPKLPVGTVLVGDFSANSGQLFRRGGIEFESSNSHQDYFTRNLIALLAEMRIAFALYVPKAYGLVTGIAPVTP